MYDTILFLDFDGTITAEETLDGSMRLCIDPVLYREKAQELMTGKRTLSETLHLAFDNIASSRLPDILAYVRGVPIRPGFKTLLERMEARGIPIVVISGGLKPYVEEKLMPYREKLLAVHSVALDCSGPTMRLVSDYERDGELLEKTLIMAQYEYRRAICVGDSHTDVRMALKSDLVFARDMLAEILEERSVPYTPWNDFFDVLNAIQKTL